MAEMRNHLWTSDNLPIRLHNQRDHTDTDSQSEVGDQMWYPAANAVAVGAVGVVGFVGFVGLSCWFLLQGNLWQVGKLPCLARENDEFCLRIGWIYEIYHWLPCWVMHGLELPHTECPWKIYISTLTYEKMCIGIKARLFNEWRTKNAELNKAKSGTCSTLLNISKAAHVSEW